MIIICVAVDVIVTFLFISLSNRIYLICRCRLFSSSSSRVVKEDTSPLILRTAAADEMATKKMVAAEQ